MAWRRALARGIRVGIGIQVEGLTKSFGPQRIWEDVTFDLPAGEVSVLLGPSGTGKSVFLKSLIGLLRPERGKIIVDGTNIIECSAKELYEIRTLFGVMFYLVVAPLVVQWELRTGVFLLSGVM